jgi:3-hydroxybutyrate dehydrogenase
MASLKGRVALVTGSTSGIGLGIARSLAAEGADIMMNGFASQADIDRERAAIENDFGVRVGYSGADLSKAAAVRQMVADTLAALGEVDILVNNAGIQFVADIVDFPEEKWDAIIAINLSAAFHGIKAAAPGMKTRGWGRIINTASAHGLVGSGQKSAYVAAKHGILGLTKVAGIELANSGVTVNAICPGWVLTPLVEKQLQDRAAKSGKTLEEEKLALVSEKQPMHEFTTPEQIGALAVFLCSDAAKTITGAPISIDGGWVAE